MYAGSSGPIAEKRGVPPGWGLAEQEFEGGVGTLALSAGHASEMIFREPLGEPVPTGEYFPF